MLQAQSSQFSLSPEGQILWQEKINNPVPGEAVAVLRKGDHVMKPVIEVLENDITAKFSAQDVKNAVSVWLRTHMTEVIEPLVLLEVPTGAEEKTDAVSRIAARIYDGLGIVPREELEDVIAELTPETRTDLRAKRIRLGPILAFIPALNKPAAVKLRALLWSLFNDAPLPAKVPADGIVSVRIEDENANPAFYRSIGYPLYGGRAVRIDMLDRVISCVYDHAEKGKFQARHEMAEWLGCPIEDLYKILEDMGHTKVYDPAEQAEENAETAAAPEAKKEAVAAEDTKEDAPKTDVKPELATFRLKKGKAFEKKGKGDSKGFKPKKFDGKKPNKKKQQGKGKPKDRGPRVISAEAKTNDADSPFAVLQQLKK